MIVVDSSAIACILLGEAEASFFAHELNRAESSCMSAATYVEIHTVIQKKMRERGALELEALMVAAGIFHLEPFTPSQARIAAEATLKFPKLNMGDRFSYALAKEKSLPLLFKGNDFQTTDLKHLIYPDQAA